ncbi:hypothetical protein L914_19883, partial [Phytophthora nicotianae]
QGLVSSDAASLERTQLYAQCTMSEPPGKMQRGAAYEHETTCLFESHFTFYSVINTHGNAPYHYAAVLPTPLQVYYDHIGSRSERAVRRRQRGSTATDPDSHSRRRDEWNQAKTAISSSRPAQREESSPLDNRRARTIPRGPRALSVWALEGHCRSRWYTNHPTNHDTRPEVSPEDRAPQTQREQGQYRERRVVPRFE